MALKIILGSYPFCTNRNQVLSLNNDKVRQTFMHSLNVGINFNPKSKISYDKLI